MFDPMQAYLASGHQPIEQFNDLDEEQYALRHGHVVGMHSSPSRLSVQLGRWLIQIGEKLTGECRHVELSREML